MSDPFEHALRERLQSMPQPRAHLDADAIVRDARRRRRPKVVGVTVTAVAACALVITPASLVALDAISPTAMDSADSGAAQPEAPSAPDDDGADPDASAPVEPPTGDEDEHAPEQSACAALPVTQAVPGLDIAFVDDPTDGTASLQVVNGTDVEQSIDVSTLGLATLGDGEQSGEIVAAARIAADTDEADPVLAPGESVTFDDLHVATEQTACDGGTQVPDGDLVPIIEVRIGDAEAIVTGAQWLP